MRKIASPQELQTELRSVLALVSTSEKPSRKVVAEKLRDLAMRVAFSVEELAQRVLGDRRYAERSRFRGWNIQPTVLQEPRLYPKIFPELTRSNHASLSHKFDSKAKKFEVDWHKAVENAEQEYGSDGPLISGGLRDHWPEDVKDSVRYLAHGTTLLKDAAQSHQKATRLRSLPE
jgi:hypothetical protein